MGVRGPPGGGARICRRASVFKGLGAKICNFRGSQALGHDCHGPRPEAPRSGLEGRSLERPSRRVAARRSSGRGPWGSPGRSARELRNFCDSDCRRAPFPGADSIVSSLCGAISGRIAFPSAGDRRPQGLRSRRPAGRHFRARIEAFQSLAAPFPAVVHAPAEPRGQGTPAVLAATARRPVERAGRERGRRSEAHRGRAFGSILSITTTALVFCTCFGLIDVPWNRWHGPRRREGEARQRPPISTATT